MVCSPTVYHFLLSCRLRAFSSPHTSSYALRNIFINNKRRTTAKQDGLRIKPDFVTFGTSIGYRWGRKKCPFALQKHAFLHFKRCPFTLQKGVFYNAKEHVLFSSLPFLFTFSVFPTQHIGSPVHFQRSLYNKVYAPPKHVTSCYSIMESVLKRYPYVGITLKNLS